MDRVKQVPGVTDVTTDREQGGLQANVTIDRTAAARLGVRIQDIDNALNDAFSQRQISTIYTRSATSIASSWKSTANISATPATSPMSMSRATATRRCRYRKWRMSSAASRRWW